VSTVTENAEKEYSLAEVLDDHEFSLEQWDGMYVQHENFFNPHGLSLLTRPLFRTARPLKDES